MTNSFYNVSGAPSQSSFGRSATIRAEYVAVQAGFNKLPTLSGNANKAWVVDPSGSFVTVTTGTFALAGNFATTGAHSLTLAVGADVTMTMPIVNGTFATLAGTETLSNKTMVAPSLGTPTALVGTNITGTAAGLTAGSAITNANLTGPITSVGNATAIASQTGTGSTFVVQTNPTINNPILTTPNLGVAVATSINGLTITTSTGNLTIANGKTITFSNTLTLTATDGSTLAIGGGGTLQAVSYSGSASDLGSGTLAAARGGAGAINGIMKANGSGVVSALSVGTGLSFDGTTLSATASTDFAQRDQQTTSGTPASVVFTGVSLEDLILNFSNFAITAGTGQLQVELSTDNGATYVTAPIVLSNATGIDTSVRQGSFFMVGLKIGRGMAFAGTGLFTTNAAPRVQTAGTPSNVSFSLGGACNAIKITTVAGDLFSNGGVVTLYGRG